MKFSRVRVNFLNYDVYFKRVGQLYMARLAQASPNGQMYVASKNSEASS